jgi:Zn-finger domain-containing protein
MFNSDVVKIVLDIHYKNNIKNIKTYYSKISKLINNKYNIKISNLNDKGLSKKGV